ncbi:TetR/AcrR family transcriptional regulator [Dyella koreensis]|uniref:TetR/AcrR family transcriptional regulator n=1 Tax=Dyella koreensis TaxID=311235 RepID=A0ABW8K4Q5_9GAMM
MARPRSFDEGDVLDRAMNVFHRHGYDGSTMAELTLAMGLTAPSIYAAFGSKRGLFEAVLDRYTDSQGESFAGVLAAPTAREVAERLLCWATDQTRDLQRPPGYLLIQAGLAAGPESADVPVTLAERRLANEVALRERFEQAKVAGDLSTAADSAALASFVTTVFYGLSVRVASGATSDELRKVVEQAMANWQALASEPEANLASGPNLLDGNAPGTRGRPREFDASSALDAAMKVFWRKGYEGTSLADLTEAMGITRPSLYATFGNKESLFFKALDQYQRVNMAYGKKALEAPTAQAFVEELLAGAVAAQLSDDQPRGCLSVINSMQGGDQSQVIRAEVLRRASEVHSLIVMRLTRAKTEGDLPASADPEGLTRLLASVLQSIATLGAAGASADQLHALANSTIAVWPHTKH